MTARRWVGLCLAVTWSALLLELGTRAYFSFRVGPEVLLWGTGWYRESARREYLRGQDVFEHDLARSGYSKYHPNQRRTDVDVAGVPFPVTINKDGFRGRDVAASREPGTLRIVALGGSSTFGFGNRDDETYPYLLEDLLNERLSARPCGRFLRAEVINLGIPHLDSRQVAALLEAEAVRLDPNFVTLYTGYNDTLGLGRSSALERVSKVSLFANFLRVLIDQRATVSESDIERARTRRTQAFMEGLNTILDTARQHDIGLIPMTQQMRAREDQLEDGSYPSYRHELTRLGARLEETESLAPLEAKLLIHAALTEALRDWAQRNGLPLLDINALLDGHRHLLSSYVHLSPLANELIAMAITDRLSELLDCPNMAV